MTVHTTGWYVFELAGQACVFIALSQDGVQTSPLSETPSRRLWESEGPKPFLFPPVVFVAKVVSRSGEKKFHLQAQDH